MTKRACHFHDGCVWPDEYGGQHCTCRRLNFGEFGKGAAWLQQPASRTEKAWGLVLMAWTPLLVVIGAVIWGALA